MRRDLCVALIGFAALMVIVFTTGCPKERQSMKRSYDSTVARIAGNIASGMGDKHLWGFKETQQTVARVTVAIARAIIAEVERTEHGATEPTAKPTDPR